MSPQPIIFISAVSKELSTAREAVAQVLRTQGYAVDYQPDFGTEQGDIREMLRRRIEPCEGLIQLVGQRYGFEPPAADETHGRVSYTQYEALHARSLPKKVWYLILDEAFPTDTQEPQAHEEASLQQAYRNRVLKGTHVYHHIPTLNSLRLKVHEMKNELEILRADWLQHRQRIESGVSKIEQMLVEQTAPGRLAAYKRSLLSAFRPYQELAIDNFAAGEQTAPAIWDIFVHPACLKEHLRPEDMDAAQRETPPRLPAHDLLPLLAQDDHRRTVLLADPGMGKSTLIQSLIAHLASGRPLSGAPALTGLLPVPLILRDLVPLLPQDQVASWSWNNLLTVLIETYQRDETSAPLCDCFKDHRDEFRQHLHTEAKVFFLIDGLDEIGDLGKRRKIVQCIQDGFLAVNKEVRWLITSRVIGYEDAPIDFARKSSIVPGDEVYFDAEARFFDSESPIVIGEYRRLHTELEILWLGYSVQSRASSLSSGNLMPLVWRGSFPQMNETRLAGPGTSFSVCASFCIAQRLHLVPFDDKRQDMFTQRWFQHRHSTDYSKELMREVRAHHHDGVRIISRVPNLLCMMNILKRSGKPLPDGRAALYDAIVQAYLGGIDSAYRLRPILGNTCPFDAPQRRFLLSLLGAHMQQTRTQQANGDEGRAAGPPAAAAALGGPSALPAPNGQPHAEGNILISRLELEKLLSPAIDAMRAAGKVPSTHTTAELLDELLHHIASRSGLLIPRSSDAEGNTLYGFTHLSFLEFFAAEWLGLEYDRQRNRIVRRSLALEEGQALTEADLDREFPPHGPIQHTREDFRKLPAIPAWHEPLIFLLESRKADAPTLLRWLFPGLHNHQPHIVTQNDPKPIPLLPLDAVQLAVKLAQDLEIPLLATTRQDWWNILWSSYLAWPHSPGDHSKNKQWPIAPLLLEQAEHRTEVLQSLAAAYAKEGGLPAPTAPPPLYLSVCSQLTSADLTHLTGLGQLEKLVLSGCTGLECLPDLRAMQGLKWLNLRGCTGLHGLQALSGLTRLGQLQSLSLDGCTGLKHLPDLRALQGLVRLSLRGCTGLHGPEALCGLTGLAQLQELHLDGCTGLERLPDLHALQRLKDLNLWDCIGLRGPEALSGLSGLVGLQRLYLEGCTGLEHLPDLRALKCLRLLDLTNCTGLHGPKARSDLSELAQLQQLYLGGCAWLTKVDVAELWHKLGKKCQIYGPDGVLME